ncbi:MAG: polysaccharide deacetylase family protein [Salinirussus sp.]
MTGGTHSPGVFTLSLDTELFWGSFDSSRLERYATAYRGTRDVVSELCELFATYDVSATWAIVAHLLTDCTASARRHADPDDGWGWRGVEPADLPCSSAVPREFWYAPEMIETIRGCETPQELGLHGYTHMPLDESCSRAAARAEIDAAVEIVRSAGISPTSFVYPRNRIGHRDLLAERGIEVYRGVDGYRFERRSVPARARKACRYVTESLERPPPVVVPSERAGLVEVPGSQLFRPRTGAWRLTAPGFQRRRALSGLERAAETGRIYHLWFHPFNLAEDDGTTRDALEDVLERAVELREDHKLEIRPLTPIATEYRAGRWRSTSTEITGRS